MGMVWMAKDEAKRGRRDDLRLGYGEPIRIATEKETGKRFILAKLDFVDGKATLYGQVMDFKLITYRGKDVYDVTYAEPKFVDINSITWANAEMSETTLNELKG
jgi:hypothetical protein